MAFFLAASIYIRRVRNIQMKNGLCKCEGGGWSVLPTQCILATGFARPDYLTTDRQTDITYLLLLLLLLLPPNKTLFSDCEMIHLQRGILRSSFACTFESLMDDGDTCISFSCLVGRKGATKRNS